MDESTSTTAPIRLKRLKALELENRRLRSVIADQALALVVVKETAEQAG